MTPFHYTRASDVADAISQIAADPAAKFIAGGTNLIDLMKYDVEHPARLIDISHLPLRSVEETPGGGLLIGALVPNSDLAYHPLIEQRYPLLSRARSWPARRSNCATWPRPAATSCSARGASTSMTPRRPATSASRAAAARRYQASTASMPFSEPAKPASPRILPTCAWRSRRSRPSCMSPARPGRATIAFADFHRLPGNTPQRDTNLEPDEIITAIELPPKGFSANYSYLKIRDRLSYAFALVSVAAALELEGDTIKEARLALGGVAHKPWRDPAAEAALRGQRADAERICASRGPPAAGRQGLRAQQLQDRAGAARHRADARARPRAARRNRNPTRKSGERHGILYRNSDIARRRQGQGHRRSQICRRVQRPRPRPWLCRRSRPSRRGASAASIPAEALRVPGVIDVLTHRNRPPMPDNDDAYKDEVAPEKGSPYRPLYDDRILFSGQPVALVLAEDWETARFAASLVRVEYQERAPRHGSARATRQGIHRREAREAARRCREGVCGGRYAPRGRVFHPDRVPQSDGIVRLDGDLGRRQAHGLRQDAGRAERAAISLRRVRDAAGRGPRHVALYGRRFRRGPAPAIPGRAGGAGGARAEAAGPRRAGPARRCRARLSARRPSNVSRSAPRPAARSTPSCTRRSP